MGGAKGGVRGLVEEKHDCSKRHAGKMEVGGGSAGEEMGFQTLRGCRVTLSGFQRGPVCVSRMERGRHTEVEEGESLTKVGKLECENQVRSVSIKGIEGEM